MNERLDLDKTRILATRTRCDLIASGLNPITEYRRSRLVRRRCRGRCQLCKRLLGAVAHEAIRNAAVDSDHVGAAARTPSHVNILALRVVDDIGSAQEMASNPEI